MSTLIRIFAIAAALLSWTVIARGDDAISIEFSLESPTISLGEPVLIDFVARNRSQDTAEIDLGHNRKANFRFTIMTPDRRVLEVPQLSSEGFGRIGRIPIPVDHSYRQVLLLDEWYDVDVPGEYEIAIRVGKSEPQVLRLQVLERDPEKLTAVAKALYGEALSLNVEVADRAALALSSIDDPVALPFLQNLLARRQPLAARGLGKIATPQAIDVLLANAGSRDIAVYAAVRAELLLLRSRILDEKTIRRIDEGLQAKPPRLEF